MTHVFSSGMNLRTCEDIPGKRVRIRLTRLKLKISNLSDLTQYVLFLAHVTV